MAKRFPSSLVEECRHLLDERLQLLNVRDGRSSEPGRKQLKKHSPAPALLVKLRFFAGIYRCGQYSA
jgi:hypothetical protein